MPVVRQEDDTSWNSCRHAGRVFDQRGLGVAVQRTSLRSVRGGAGLFCRHRPAGAVWYFHADFAAMRTGDAGRALFDWLDGEVFEEIRDDSGVDLSKEANQITAFAQQGTGIVIIIDGDISQESQDKMLALATLSGEQRTQKSGGKEYYFVSDGDDHDVENEHVRVSLDIDSLEDSAFVSLALKNKVIVTSSEDTMHALLDSNGAPKISSSEEGALFVLSADRNLMQAGMLADEFDYDEDWNSISLRTRSRSRYWLLMPATNSLSGLDW